MTQLIKPPASDWQYRAIGIVKGRYIPSQSEFNMGVILAEDGTVIEAVLLGKVVNLLKKKISLDASHGWVCYPKVKKDKTLHLQILGVYQNLEALPKSSVFNIRGEVIYQNKKVSPEATVIKVLQENKKQIPDQLGKIPKIKSFKLEVTGQIPFKAVGFFCDINATVQDGKLVLESAYSIGKVKKPPKKKTSTAVPPVIKKKAGVKSQDE